MSWTRIAGLAAVLAALAVAAPVASARADDGAGPNTVLVDGLGPMVGQTVAVIGATIITTAPSSYINVVNQITATGGYAGTQGIIT